MRGEDADSAPALRGVDIEDLVGHVAAVDADWTSAAEHGMNASTFTARVIASTGADVAAALSGASAPCPAPSTAACPPASWA